jgi:hypothetical protein
MRYHLSHLFRVQHFGAFRSCIDLLSGSSAPAWDCWFGVPELHQGAVVGNTVQYSTVQYSAVQCTVQQGVTGGTMVFIPIPQHSIQCEKDVGHEIMISTRISCPRLFTPRGYKFCGNGVQLLMFVGSKDLPHQGLLATFKMPSGEMVWGRRPQCHETRLYI